MKKNKTRPRVAEILLETYGFAPTKRQLDRRFELWGFRKNSSKKERHTIIGSSAKIKTIGKHGKVVNLTTIRRWEKEIHKAQSQGLALDLDGRKHNLLSC